MSSTFGGLEMGRSALNAFRLGMQTVGHNISNMGTEGYSRQRVNFATATPEDLPNVGQLGQGMVASDIERIRDEFLDFQFRDVQSTLGYWEKMNDLYDSIQNYIAEPTSSGIREAMDTFFTNVQNLQQSPEDTSVRQALVTSANSFGLMLGNLVDSFNTYNQSINLEVKQAVDDANRMLHNLAELNLRISNAEALGQNANDLMDQRDLILDNLSKMMDISYNEPLEHNGIKGEFFLSVNGRVLVQGTHVRELAAHSFLWDNQVYYDVQVTENEFDIVSDPNIADALATGPEGTYQLTVDRIANATEWTTGGGDAHCLETYRVKTSALNSNILDANSADIPYKLQFRSLDNDGTNTPHTLTVKIDRVNASWILRAEIDGEQQLDNNGNVITTDFGDTLTADELVQFIQDKANGNINLNAEIDGNRVITFSNDGRKQLEVHDYSGLLGNLTEFKQELDNVNMRTKPANLDDPLNISGSFRIQVGTQGTRITSDNFRAAPNKGLEEGEILSTPKDTDNKNYTFRVGVAGEQVDFSANWNDTLGKWVLSSDLSTETKIIDSTNSVGDFGLKVNDLTTYMKSVLQNAARNSDNPELAKLSITEGKSSSGIITQFFINSNDYHLLSISDVQGNLAAQLGMVNSNPVITIDVESSDSLITIRNKINEKYSAEFGLTDPTQWVHASVDNGYLEISADVAGEAQRITLMGGTDGNLQVLRRLGLTANQEISTGELDDDGNTISTFREITYIPNNGIAEDASFTLNNVRYLSSDNMFSKARRIPAVAGENKDRFSAKTLSEVSDGMRLNLKATGSTTITVRHHIQNGSIKALEEIRDGLIPDFKESLDDLAYGLTTHLNALQYSGYGIGDNISTTGKAFFNTPGTKANSAQKLSVSEVMSNNPSLIGAAIGLKDANGLSLKGVSSGAGDGSNAARMVGLNLDKLFENGTMTLGGIYDAMLSQIGTEAASAKLLHTTEQTVSEQINSQRQAVSGVNLDEELMNMIVLNRAFGAMSRYITTYDEMLDKIINGFGLVGR